MWPHRRQPTRLPHPWDSPGENTGVGCHFLLQCVKVRSETEVAQSCLTLSDPMDCSYQAPLSMGFSRQEYWSGVPLPSPINILLYIQWASLVAQLVKNPPAMWETRVQSLVWKIPWRREWLLTPVLWPGKFQLQRVGHDWLHFHFSPSCIGEGNGNPLQCFCLENPRDKGAWWAAVCGVTQSRTRLKWLSSSSSRN